MKTLFFVFFSLVVAHVLPAQTYINDGQQVYGTWTKSSSPYIIKGEAIVPEGKTLIIESGVTVKFKTGNDYYYCNYIEGKYVKNVNFDRGFLRVQGTLKAEGTAQDSILFTRHGEEGKWGVISFENSTGENVINYCIVEHSLYINYNMFDSNTSKGALSFIKSKGIISNSTMRYSEAGIMVEHSSDIIVQFNTIHNCKHGLSIGHSAVANIKNNIIFNNSTNCYIYYTKLSMTNCTFYQSGTYLNFLIQGAEVDITNCLVAGETGDVFVLNSNQKASLSINYSVVKKENHENIHYLEGVIFDRDPKFRDLNAKDFRLKKNSPYISKGLNNSYIGAYEPITEKMADKPKPVKNTVVVPTPKPVENTAVIPKTKRLALLIGNANYETSPLKNPVNDATDIASALRNYGFETTLRTNLDLQGMKNAISAFSNQIQTFKAQGYHVSALFYYSGHGLQHQNENYLVPISHKIAAVGDIAYETYPNSRILSNLADAHAQIVMIDACRNEPTFRSLFRDGIGDFEEGLLTPTVPPFKPSESFKDLPQGTFISFAAAPKTRAQDGAGRNSPYVEGFLKVLREKKALELRSFFGEVKKEVLNKTQNTQRSWTNDDLIGDFYFTK